VDGVVSSRVEEVGMAEPSVGQVKADIPEMEA